MLGPLGCDDVENTFRVAHDNEPVGNASVTRLRFAIGRNELPSACRVPHSGFTQMGLDQARWPFLCSTLMR